MAGLQAFQSNASGEGVVLRFYGEEASQFPVPNGVINLGLFEDSNVVELTPAELTSRIAALFDCLSPAGEVFDSETFPEGVRAAAVRFTPPDLSSPIDLTMAVEVIEDGYSVTIANPYRLGGPLVSPLRAVLVTSFEVTPDSIGGEAVDYCPMLPSRRSSIESPASALALRLEKFEKALEVPL